MAPELRQARTARGLPEVVQSGLCKDTPELDVDTLLRFHVFETEMALRAGCCSDRLNDCNMKRNNPRGGRGGLEHALGYEERHD